MAKTLAKMSDHGRTTALAIDMDTRSAVLLARAIAEFERRRVAGIAR